MIIGSNARARLAPALDLDMGELSPSASNGFPSGIAPSFASADTDFRGRPGTIIDLTSERSTSPRPESAFSVYSTESFGDHVPASLRASLQTIQTAQTLSPAYTQLATPSPGAVERGVLSLSFAYDDDGGAMRGGHDGFIHNSERRPSLGLIPSTPKSFGQSRFRHGHGHDDGMSQVQSHPPRPLGFTRTSYASSSSLTPPVSAADDEDASFPLKPPMTTRGSVGTFGQGKDKDDDYFARSGSGSGRGTETGAGTGEAEALIPSTPSSGVGGSFGVKGSGLGSGLGLGLDMDMDMNMNMGKSGGGGGQGLIAARSAPDL